MDEFPASERVPSALYKGRACLLELGQSQAAWDMGGRLLDEFPQSAEAALLREENSSDQ